MTSALPLLPKHLRALPARSAHPLLVLRKNKTRGAARATLHLDLRARARQQLEDAARHRGRSRCGSLRMHRTIRTMGAKWRTPSYVTRRKCRTTLWSDGCRADFVHCVVFAAFCAREVYVCDGAVLLRLFFFEAVKLLLFATRTH
jgi:hypothetical protein